MCWLVSCATLQLDELLLLLLPLLACSGGATWASVSSPRSWTAVAVPQSGSVVAAAAQGTWTQSGDEWTNSGGGIFIRCARLVSSYVCSAHVRCQCLSTQLCGVK
jgi:hypothetical protein